MGRVFLVRHAQASFLHPNYDKLSAIGEVQARRLGEFWAQDKITFDRVCSGPAARHLNTAAIVADAYTRSGQLFPQPDVLDEFDEFQGDAMLERSLPQLLKNDARVRDLHAVFQNSSSETDRHANFQRLFEVVVTMWVEGQILVNDVESWPEFCGRVNRGLSKFLTNGRGGEQVAIFSSGGPMGVAVQRALNLSALDTLRVAWMARNCSYSEFLFSGERFTLSTFNSFPHLDDKSLLTYR
jgi:broad specificity phosphatase PhoE